MNKDQQSIMSYYICTICSTISEQEGDCPKCNIPLTLKKIEEDWKGCCD